MKESREITIGELYLKFETHLKPRFTTHTFNIGHQYRTLRSLKEQMSADEVTVHVDFSENYTCRYGEEIQSVHFGGSHRQASLHTGVYYTTKGTQSFCSISDCTRHDPAGIWAHLQPVLRDIRASDDNITTINFVSDGPTTQYRNKSNFYLASVIPRKLGYGRVTWNLIDKLTRKTNKCFSILSTNIQSLNSKFSELEAFVDDLSKTNFKFSVICLQEAWLTDNDDLCLFSLPGYDCISQGKHCSGKGGLVIYVDNTYISKVKLNINMHESWEGLIVRITGGGLTKTVTLGNIYRPPRSRNDDLNSFINEFGYIISSLENNNSHLIFAGDFNINLLKLNENDTYSNFFDTLISHSLYPLITLPTRFTRTNGTLIDNFFCKLCKSVLESTAGILTKRFSDHQPYFMMLNTNQKTNPPPKFIKKYNTSDEAMLNVRHEIQSEELFNKLDKSCTADINLNYEMLNDEILRAKHKHMRCKLVKFNKYKHKKSTWITQGLLKSIRYRDKLYKKLRLSNPNTLHYDTLKFNLKTYNLILRKSIISAKQTYYESRFNRIGNDIRRTWKTINEILTKNQTKNKFPTVFNDDGSMIADRVNIANKFNVFFTNIGEKIAK